ncbi:hypothetical protein OIU79_006826 [Salix purpurea]|uniref:Uncharacterized protein n=1 Tax=Salix purpurea TaxID=77065 RepID=A0A9Q0Z2R1_SALPP|nr:hypothetical protein OIU79_006826 [Salix purpurea]
MAATYSPSMAPRYVPNRGQVMKKSLKKIVGLCTGIRASPIHHCDKQGFLQFDMAATYSPSMAPRYVPKRGQVLKKSLKKIFGLCIGIRASRIHHCDQQGFLSN